jgi:drug/metabolite transporter (DMT)-like permease
MKFIRRYQSDIYGNYRFAALRDGALAGLVIGGVVLFCKLIYYPIYAPENYVTDITLLVATLFFAYRYRSRLPEKRVFFKELMLYGLWLGVVAAVVYGLFLLFYGGVVDKEFPARCLEHFIYGEQQGSGTDEEKAATIAVMRTYRLHTWAFIGAFRTAVMAIMTAFVAALVFRTEKNKVKEKTK